MSDERPMSLHIELPPEVGNGVYANAASVWHTPYDFTLDFLVLGGPAAIDADGNEQLPTVPVVARVKIPTQVIFQVAKAIADNVDKYEQRFGRITPAPPLADRREGSMDEEDTE